MTIQWPNYFNNKIICFLRLLNPIYIFKSLKVGLLQLNDKISFAYKNVLALQTWKVILGGDSGRILHSSIKWTSFSDSRSPWPSTAAITSFSISYKKNWQHLNYINIRLYIEKHFLRCDWHQKMTGEKERVVRAFLY
jgi:hypothetical protein